MRGATRATAGSQKWPSSASNQPRRGTTSESRNATKSVVHAARPVLRAAAGPLLRGWRSTWTSQCMPAKSACWTGTAEPSSTTTTRMPRSVATSRCTPEALSRTGITTVTSRCDGPLAGRGWATVASSSVRATCALSASCTSSRPPLSMVCAAGPAAAPGWANHRAERSPRPVPSPGDPPARRTRRAAAGRSCQHPVAVGRPAHDAARTPVDHLGKYARALGRGGRGGITEHPQFTHRRDPPPRIRGISSASGALLPGSRSSVHTSSGEICSNTDVSVCPAWASAFSTVHGHHPTSRPS